jgi:hypothetical protein
MSIESMASGGTVTKRTATHTTGAMGGDSITYSEGSEIVCNPQIMASNDVLRYDARGQMRGYTIFFAEDPSFDQDDQVALSKMNETTINPAKILRVLDTYEEGSPSGDLHLWIVDCEWIDTRRDA